MVRSAASLGTVPVLIDELAGDLLDRLARPDAVRFRSYATRLTQGEPVRVEESAAAEAVRPYSWVLGRLGADGVRLTSAGYLPPTVVTEAVSALGWHDRWIGAANREYHTTPVLELAQGRAGTPAPARPRKAAAASVIEPPALRSRQYPAW
jgi:hypothetical protein